MGGLPNHIAYIKDKHVYRFIIELYEKEASIKKYINSIDLDRKAFNRLKKYNIQPTKSYIDKVEEKVIAKNQIISFMYMLYSIDGLDNKEEYQEPTFIVNSVGLKKLFSILFYGMNDSRSFHKTTLEMKNKVENISSLHSYFDIDTYL